MRTEGIKSRDDPYRIDPHMSIPIVLAFDAVSVLTIDGVEFSTGMLSKSSPNIGRDDSFFDEILFQHVYHDGPLNPDIGEEIRDRRMSEVIVPEQLPLDENLRRIICRTEYDKQTLYHYLGDSVTNYSDIVRVEQIHGSVFMHQGLYISNISLDENSIILHFHKPNRLPANRRYNAQVEQVQDDEVANVVRGFVPTDWQSVKIAMSKYHEDTIWKIELEDVLAYCGSLPTDTTVLR